jgi:hypothetical protein
MAERETQAGQRQQRETQSRGIIYREQMRVIRHILRASASIWCPIDRLASNCPFCIRCVNYFQRLSAVRYFDCYHVAERAPDPRRMRCLGVAEAPLALRRTQETTNPSFVGALSQELANLHA